MVGNSYIRTVSRDFLLTVLLSVAVADTCEETMSGVMFRETLKGNNCFQVLCEKLLQYDKLKKISILPTLLGDTSVICQV